ncbi:hypothetical protein [Lysobacter gummosus]|uniref:hypothetical protein n=1 Tax=Lysobacter gummosus TaxID=262324 RepID=UPI00364446FA
MLHSLAHKAPGPARLRGFRVPGLPVPVDAPIVVAWVRSSGPLPTRRLSPRHEDHH